MKILLLVPYCGGSHRSWAEGYSAHSQHDVTLLALPARFWKWRMQGGAVTLAEAVRELPTLPDAILATDMVNLPAFLGLTRDRLSAVPVALYCHENQLTYPVPPREKRDLTYGMINWMSMLAADRVYFNSEYHLEDWFGALPNMLKHFPDCRHLHLVPGVRARASVLPVGCDLKRLDGIPRSDLGKRPVILWNQRWEYDKAPQTFLRATCTLDDEGLDFRVAIAGKSYRQAAPEFEAARETLGDRVVHFGFAEGGAYDRLLRGTDIVVSTAIHEFFGVSVVEAVYGGCFPVLPNQLSYRELIPGAYHDVCLYEGSEEMMAQLRWALRHEDEIRCVVEMLREAVGGYAWATMAPVYDACLEQIARMPGASKVV